MIYLRVQTCLRALSVSVSLSLATVPAISTSLYDESCTRSCASEARALPALCQGWYGRLLRWPHGTRRRDPIRLGPASRIVSVNDIILIKPFQETIKRDAWRFLGLRPDYLACNVGSNVSIRATFMLSDRKYLIGTWRLLVIVRH